jgi:replicative DNA helicase
LANKEHALLSYIIKNGKLNEAIEWGLTADDFTDGISKKMFDHMLTMRRDPSFKGAQMGVNSIKTLYPAFNFCDDDTMSVEAYCINVRKERLLQINAGVAQDLSNTKDDPVITASRCLSTLQTRVLSVGYGQQNDVSFASALDRGIIDHDLRQSGKDMSVAKWPWEPFNTASGGLEKDDYICFYGRPKSKKSWVLAEFIADIYRQGKTPLVYTKEMTADNIFKRVGACLEHLPYQDFRLGRLSDEERQRLTKLLNVANDLRRWGKDMICLDGKDTSSGDTIEWLTSKVQKYKPDVVFIDGLYLMSDNRGGKGQKDNFRVQNISRAAREMVLMTGTPLVATMQATRTAAAHKGANLDEIAYSDAIGQDVTAAIRVINEDFEEELPRITMVVGGAREFRFNGCQIYGVPATNFEYIRELSQKEVDKAKEHDEKRDDKETGSAAKPGGDPIRAKNLATSKKRENSNAFQGNAFDTKCQ